MEADVMRAANLLGLAIANLEGIDEATAVLETGSPRRSAVVHEVRAYFDALRERMREEQVARDEAWTLVSQQVTRLLHPALDRQTVNEVGATVNKVADAMLADEPLPEDVAALLPSVPMDEMHRDGTPKAPPEPVVPDEGLDVLVDGEEDEPVPVYPAPTTEPVRRCDTRWASNAAHHIHGCTRQLNHTGSHVCSCDASFSPSR